MNNKDIKLEEKKVLFRNDEYTIFADGYIDTKVPLTNICYELALFLQRKEDENKQLREAYEICKEFIEQCIEEGTVSDGYANDILEDAQQALKEKL